MNQNMEAALPSVGKHYRHDHARLDELLQRFESLNGTNFAAASPIFAEFKSGLERHIAWEEEILFPIFENKTSMRDSGPTVVMRWEHTLIKDFLYKIHGRLAQQQKASGEDVQAIRNLLQIHNHKEENTLYPALDSMLDSAERARAFAEMEKHHGGHLPEISAR